MTARTQFYYVDPLTSTFGRRQYLPHVMDYLPVRSITVCEKKKKKKKLSHQCGPPLIGQTMTKRYRLSYVQWVRRHFIWGERGGSVVECRTPEREVRGSRATAAVLCPWARHFTPRKYWLITQEAMAPSRHDWKIVDWDVKPQHNQPTISSGSVSTGTGFR